MKLEPQLHERDENDGNGQGQGRPHSMQDASNVRLSLFTFDAMARCDAGDRSRELVAPSRRKEWFALRLYCVM